MIEQIKEHLAQRVIKFRAWHFGLNRMFSAEEMANDQLTLLPTGQFINVSGNRTSDSVIYPRDMMIPLQFTGETYSDGSEVYEGDEYEYDYEYDSDYDGDMPIVKRSVGRGVVKHMTDTYAIRKAKEEGGKVKIIGNIFQKDLTVRK